MAGKRKNKFDQPTGKKRKGHESPSEGRSMQEILAEQSGFKLCVRGISIEISELDIEKEFSKFGTIVEIYNSGHGCVFITFRNQKDSVNATHQLNNSIMFGHQITVEMARKGLRDLPAEIIQVIDQYLPFTDRKNFRQVCLMCPSLRRVYKDKIEETGVMNIELQNLQLCTKFVNDFHFLVKSSFDFNLTLPARIGLSKVENLRCKVIELIDICEERISGIYVCYDVVHSDLLKMILPKLTHLKRIAFWQQHPGTKISVTHFVTKIILQSVSNNFGSLEYVTLPNIYLPDIEWNEMPNLKYLRLKGCGGSNHSLYSSAKDVSKVKTRLEIDISIGHIIRVYRKV